MLDKSGAKLDGDAAPPPATSACAAAPAAAACGSRKPADKRVNLLRTEQALETNPEVIAVSCPFCMTMLADGIKAKDLEERVQTLDVMEIVDRAAK